MCVCVCVCENNHMWIRGVHNYMHKEDDKIVTDKEIDEWKWKSYHKIDVKQNMGDGRHNDMYQNRNKTLRVCLVTLF